MQPASSHNTTDYAGPIVQPLNGSTRFCLEGRQSFPYGGQKVTSPIFYRFFFVGSFLRLVLAMSRSCFSDIDFTICFEAPLRLDFLTSPRFAARAAPAAICCFLDFAGISLDRLPRQDWLSFSARGVAGIASTV